MSDYQVLLPLLKDFGVWLSPVVTTLVGAYLGNMISERSLEKATLRDRSYERRKLLEEKAEKILGALNAVIDKGGVSDLSEVDAMVRLYFDDEVVKVYSKLRIDLKNVAMISLSVSKDTYYASQLDKFAKVLNKKLQE